MATKTSSIPKHEWDRHKAKILELYCERRFPLTQRKDTKDEHECVDWIMKHQYGFVASKSQYEAQLRLWGATKNLKQSEWVSLLLEYNQLEHQGKDVRIVISGQVQTEEKINKARRRYLKRASGTSSTASLGQAVASYRHCFIEVNEDGQWRRFPSDRTPDPNDTMAWINRTPQSDQDCHEQATPSPNAMALSPQCQSMSTRELSIMAQSSAMNMPSMNNDSEGIDPGDPELSIMAQSSALNTPSMNNDSQSTDIGDRATSRPRTDMPFSSSWLKSGCPYLKWADRLVPMDRQDPRTTSALVLQCESYMAGVLHSTSHLEFRGLFDHFAALLSDILICGHPHHSTILVQPSSEPYPLLFDTLLYSVINGFVGIEAVPRISVLELLRENFSHISKLLRSGPDSVAEPIVDNLFPAAIEAGDVQAVESLLQATRNNPAMSIDLSKIVYRVSAGIYTPLGLAIVSGSSGVVRLMLQSGADPNREIGNNGSGKALCLATSLPRFNGEYPILDIVRLLLDFGAEIDAESISRAIDGAEKNALVLKELVQRLPANKHAICFSLPQARSNAVFEGDMLISPRYKHQALAEDIVRYVEKSVATSLVKRLVGYCTSTSCQICIPDHPELLQSMLLHAARRDDLELVTFLAPYATSLHQALAGAVRSGNYQLITFLVENGARADGPAVHVTVNSKIGETEPITPLAEAIRREDEELIHFLADYGAWRRFDDRFHLEAAINAAAEVGSVRYLEAILHRISPGERPPYSALNKAIARGNSECALALLRAGTPACGNRSAGSANDALSLALQGRKKNVVDALLDCGVHFANRPQQSLDGLPQVCCTMELAGQWGDTEIIDGIASMGANLDAGLHTTALAAAVAARNRPVVDHILDLGADPGAKALLGRSPLSEAVKNQDHPMIDHLLSKGATPADTSAFLTAVECDQVALEKLSQAFKRKYPFGLKQFGGKLIAGAVERNNSAILSIWLDLKVDPVGMEESSLLYPGRIHSPEPHQDRISPLGFAIKLAKDDGIQMVDLLLRSGAPVNAIAFESDEWRGEARIRTFKTPLLLAVRARNKKLVSLLLDNGADINRPARRGVLCTPLQEACREGSYELVELLLQKGADINSPAARRYGGTALQMAARSGSLKIVDLLLQKKADPHAPGSEFGEGGTAFELAAEYGRYHVLLLLWNTVPRGGLTAAILRYSKDRAEKNGYKGCAELITHILHDSSFERSSPLRRTS